MNSARPAGQALRGGAGRAEPLRGVEEIRAEWLLRRARPDLGEQIRVRLRGALDRTLELWARDPRTVGVHGERTADPGRGVLQRAQHVLGLDHHRLLGYLRSHERVAIPVRADPAAKPQERNGCR